MGTGLEYEGEAARKRFVVYWLRPAIAALAFGVFTFFVVSVPGEKEKIKLRDEASQLRQVNEASQRKLRELLPLANAARAQDLTQVHLGIPSDTGPWGRVLFDDGSGRGVVIVKGLDIPDRRAFCWWFDSQGVRQPLAAIDLTDGAGHASIQLGPERQGSFLITLEALEGEPSSDREPVLEAAVY